MGSHFYLSTLVLLLLFQVVPSIAFPLAYVLSLVIHSFKLSRSPNAQRQNVLEKKYQGQVEIHICHKNNSEQPK